MKRRIAGILVSSVCLGLTTLALAQSYSIDRFAVSGGGGTSTGGTFELGGTSGQTEAGRMSGSRYTIEGGFWSFLGIHPTVVAATTIFENTNGIFNGNIGATTTLWHAGKFCLGQRSYQLESVAWQLQIFDLHLRSSNVRLQIYANDPLKGLPSADTGVIMSLSGMTNPITLLPSNSGPFVTWTPSTPFTLSANKCYWAVLSVESGAVVNATLSETIPTGEAGTRGRTTSSDAGTTWGAPDNSYNYKMLIRGTPSAPPPALVVTAVSVSGTDLRFSFPTSVGQSYVIESWAGLASGAWAEVPGTKQTSVGAAFEVSLPIRQSQSQQFFRVKQLP